MGNSLLLRGHQAPRCSLMGPCQVPLQGPHPTPNQRQGRDAVSEGPGGGRGSLCRSGVAFVNRNLTSLSRKEDMCVALCCTFHSEWNGYWVPIMEGCRIPLIRHQTTRPVPPLRRLWVGLIVLYDVN